MSQVVLYRIYASPLARSKDFLTVKRYQGYFACAADDPNPAETISKHLAKYGDAELVLMEIDTIGEIDHVLGTCGGSRSIFDEHGEVWTRILQGWLAERQVKTLYIEPGSPWQNGHVESFHGSLRDECLDRELMLSVAEARVLIEDYRRHYNEERPHGGIGYRTLAQARIEAQALDSSRPAGSLRQELESSQPHVTIQT